MRYPSEEFQSLVGYSEKYGVHLGPYDDSRFSFSSRLVFWLGIPLGVGLVTPGYTLSRVGVIGDDLNEEMLSTKRGSSTPTGTGTPSIITSGLSTAGTS